MLSNIIVGKTKHVKDPFADQILHEASHGAAYRHFNDFWENWGNARTKGKEQKAMSNVRAKGALQEILPGYTP